MVRPLTRFSALLSGQTVGRERLPAKDTGL